MQMLFNANIVLSYVPEDQPLKICVKEMWPKNMPVLFVLIGEKVI